MSDLNKVMIIGRLTRDPEIRQLPNTTICQCGIAAGREWYAGDEKRSETMFIDIVIFGKQADAFAKYTNKGKQIYVEGRLKLDQWDDKSTGQKRSKISLVVENFIFLGAPGESRNESPQSRSSKPSIKKSPPAEKSDVIGDAPEFDPNEIPF